ncbi:putative pentatricopeptide repeat-containing protein [Tripterygium wilfordii]|uniref:Putative pentatricopeptide repeat-containing protein n=1 Tax=Tripterygium wilfordii TaxID=458696 RepID=A0A7J7DP52_TRIWF|nr:putative pentatricopeptide repeat-containing protein [Tripterygium wilfordii]
MEDPKPEDRCLPDHNLNCLHEQAQTPDRRQVESQRHRREPHDKEEVPKRRVFNPQSQRVAGTQHLLDKGSRQTYSPLMLNQLRETPVQAPLRLPSPIPQPTLQKPSQDSLTHQSFVNFQQQRLKPLLNPLNQSSFELNYRHICELLLSQTHSRTLPKGLQIHAHIIKSGLQSLPLISHHLINFYSKTQLPLLSCQAFHECSRLSSTTWSSIISSFAQNELPCLAIDYFRRMLHDNVRPDDHIFPSATKSCAILGRHDVGFPGNSKRRQRKKRPSNRCTERNLFVFFYEKKCQMIKKRKDDLPNFTLKFPLIHNRETRMKGVLSYCHASASYESLNPFNDHLITQTRVSIHHITYDDISIRSILQYLYNFGSPRVPSYGILEDQVGPCEQLDALSPFNPLSEK